MNLFYERFPKTVDVDGKKYQIYTDFRDFLRLFDILKKEDDEIKIASEFLSMYKDRIPRDYKKAIMAIVDFVLDKNQKEENDAESDEENREEKKKLISYEKDAPYIIGDFLRFYGIDLISCEYLHWMKFQVLLEGLPEDSETKKRIGYRAIDSGKIKDKDERNRIIRIQKMISIEDNEADAERIGDLFGGLMA